MFRHPLYPFMLADVDYFITMPDGTKAILEIKTTNYNAKDHWWKDGRETVPAYYEPQGRHYSGEVSEEHAHFTAQRPKDRGGYKVKAVHYLFGNPLLNAV
jgi:predicted phage-related endonuclease